MFFIGQDYIWLLPFSSREVNFLLPYFFLPIKAASALGVISPRNCLTSFLKRFPLPSLALGILWVLYKGVYQVQVVTHYAHHFLLILSVLVRLWDHSGNHGYCEYGQADKGYIH